jgi:hypothetical protein
LLEHELTEQKKKLQKPELENAKVIEKEAECKELCKVFDEMDLSATNSAAAAKGKMKLTENILMPPLLPPITRNQERSAQSPVRPQTSTPLQKKKNPKVMSEDEFVLFDTEMNPPSWETGSNSSFNRMFDGFK